MWHGAQDGARSQEAKRVMGLPKKHSSFPVSEYRGLSGAAGGFHGAANQTIHQNREQAWPAVCDSTRRLGQTMRWSQPDYHETSAAAVESQTRSDIRERRPGRGESRRKCKIRCMASDILKNVPIGTYEYPHVKPQPDSNGDNA